jgi:DNA-binding XRE family transcriptional regulator
MLLVNFNACPPKERIILFFREFLSEVVNLLKSKLKDILDDRGIKHSHIARKVNINVASMSQLINNRSAPTYKTAYYIAKELNMKMEDIWYFEEE